MIHTQAALLLSLVAASLAADPAPAQAPAPAGLPQAPSPAGLPQAPAPAPPQARPAVSDSTLDMALQDKRFIQRQIKCALGEVPCDPVGRRLKTLAPLVLRGSCPQCSPQEMKQIQRTLGYVQRNYPHEWARIVRQYAG